MTAFIDVQVVPMDRERVLAHQTVLVRGTRNGVTTILHMGGAPAEFVDLYDPSRRFSAHSAS